MHCLAVIPSPCAARTTEMLNWTSLPQIGVTATRACRGGVAPVWPVNPGIRGLLPGMPRGYAEGYAAVAQRGWMLVRHPPPSFTLRSRVDHAHDPLRIGPGLRRRLPSSRNRRPPPASSSASHWLPRHRRFRSGAAGEPSGSPAAARSGCRLDGDRRPVLQHGAIGEHEHGGTPRRSLDQPACGATSVMVTTVPVGISPDEANSPARSVNSPAPCCPW